VAAAAFACALFFAAALAAGAAVADVVGVAEAAPADSSERFTEDLWVREASVLVGVPPTTLALRPSRVDPRRPENWLLLEDGRPAEILRVEPAWGNEADPWEVWIWRDNRLVAGLAARAVDAVLEDAAGELGGFGATSVRPASRGGSARERRDLAEMAAALDRLVLDVAERPAPAAGLLILPVAPLRLSANSWNALSRHDAELAEPRERFLVRSLVDATQSLAALGWTPIVLAPRDAPRPGDETADRRGNADLSSSAPPDGVGTYRVGPGRAPSAGAAAWADTALAIDLLAWRRFVDRADGLVVRDGADLVAALRAVKARYRLWYRTSRPPDGQDGSVEVRWLHNGAAVLQDFPRRRGVPEAVARSRARYLARYGVDRLGTLSIDASLRDPAANHLGTNATTDAARDAPARLALSVDLPAAPTELDPAPPAYVRLACARRVAGANDAKGRPEASVASVWAGVRLAERPRAAGRFATDLACAGSAAAGFVVVIEDFETGGWGAVSAAPAP
jgi:hypothetical protein